MGRLESVGLGGAAAAWGMEWVGVVPRVLGGGLVPWVLGVVPRVLKAADVRGLRVAVLFIELAHQCMIGQRVWPHFNFGGSKVEMGPAYTPAPGANRQTVCVQTTTGN